MDASFRIDHATSVPCPAPDGWVNELVRSHVRLVERVARRVFHEVSSAIPVEDLVQVGNIALIMAAKTFVDRGTAMFTTYANIRVRGAMIDELRKTATISRGAMRRRRQFAEVRQELGTSLGRAPSDDEMANRLDMAIGAYRTAIDSMQTLDYTSIDDAYADTSSWFADPSPGADEVLEGNQRRAAIASAITKLPKREQVVLQMVFVDECSLDEIGKVFNVSSARICQIKRAALETLRDDLGRWRDD